MSRMTKGSIDTWHERLTTNEDVPVWECENLIHEIEMLRNDCLNLADVLRMTREVIASEVGPIPESESAHLSDREANIAYTISATDKTIASLPEDLGGAGREMEPQAEVDAKVMGMVVHMKRFALADDVGVNAVMRQMLIDAINARISKEESK